jgi:hypothetical protein
LAKRSVRQKRSSGEIEIIDGRGVRRHLAVRKIFTAATAFGAAATFAARVRVRVSKKLT